jgi:hypothetical protein
MVIETTYIPLEDMQIKEAFKHGKLPSLFDNISSEQYYNETYKGGQDE